MKRNLKKLYPILLVGILFGVITTLAAWALFWSGIRNIQFSLIAQIAFVIGVVAIIASGLLVRRRHPFLSNLGIIIVVILAVGLSYLFPQAFLPGCGGIPRVFANRPLVLTAKEVANINADGATSISGARPGGGNSSELGGIQADGMPSVLGAHQECTGWYQSTM